MTESRKWTHWLLGRGFEANCDFPADKQHDFWNGGKMKVGRFSRLVDRETAHPSVFLMPDGLILPTVERNVSAVCPACGWGGET